MTAGGRDFVRRSAPPFAVALVTWWWAPRLAVVSTVAGVVLMGLRLATHGEVDRAISRMSAAVGDATFTVLLAAVYTVIVVPGWLLGRLRRPTRRDEFAIRPPDAAAHQRRPFAPHLRPSPPGPSAPRRAASMAVVALGAAVTLVVVDAAAGTWYSHRRPLPITDARLPDEYNGPTGTRLSLLDPRDGALAQLPDAPGLVAEQRGLALELWPILAYRTRPHTGPTVHTDGWVRRSFRSPGRGARPRVLLMGGSLAFGTGQRDAFTVASELARLAAADGLAVDVENRGQPGWTTWQAWLAFEQATAGSPQDRPVEALFLTGSEDGRAYTPRPGVPSHTGFDLLQAQLEDRLHSDDHPSPVAAWWRKYRRTSLALRAWRGVAGGAPAGADPLVAQPLTVADATDVYRRARTIAKDIGHRRNITVRFALGPVRRRDRTLRALAPVVTDASTADLTRLLGDDAAFLPDGGIGEADTATVAAALWPRLRPAVARWYAQHR